MAEQRRASSSRLHRLLFDGDESKYEVWETKLLGHLHLLGLKDTVLKAPVTQAEKAADPKKNEDAYAELIQLLDDKSLCLVMRDGKDDGRKALKILKDYYAGSGKPRIISLYTTLTSLQKSNDESVMDYIIRAETAITALRSAGETLGDGLLVAMALKGLPESFKPFAIHVAHTYDNITFADFKTKLRSFEETENIRATGSNDDSVMKTQGRTGRRPPKASSAHRPTKDDSEMVCFKCGTKGHRARACRQKTWCSVCKSDTHRDATCRRKDKDRDRRDGVSKVSENAEVTGDFAFTMADGRASDHQRQSARTIQERGLMVDTDGRASDQREPGRTIQERGLMVDTGATSHVINDIAWFTSFDSTFRPETHSVELADGTRCSGVAQRRGTAVVTLIDSSGRRCNAKLRDALYVPSYPQNIFSVKAATTTGSTVIFKEGDDALITRCGTRFDIHVYGRLYYLHTEVESNDDKCNATHDIQAWHEILGHCNYDDVLRLHDVVDGMQIKGKMSRPEQECEVCIQGKFTQTRNRNPDARAKAPLEMVHTDLAGPIATESLEGYKYAQSFTDDYSNAVFVYFLKKKSDTVQATEKFLADVSPYGKVKCMRSDNAAEFTGGDFQALLRKSKIRHETSAPYSPHQNGTAERGWRTLFEMGRCMLIESELPKHLWHYAVQTAAMVRNRCLNKRTGLTPYEMLTNKKPNVSRMQRFGSVCYTYKQEKGKLDSRCDQGRFVGYDKNSPAYLVYLPNTNKVQKHRLVKFVSKTVAEKHTQTDEPDLNDDSVGHIVRTSGTQGVNRSAEKAPEPNEPSKSPHRDSPRAANESTDETESVTRVDPESRRYPTRVRRAPNYLGDFVTEDSDSDGMNVTVDYCCRAVCGIPQTYGEAMQSDSSKQWRKAMDEEIQSLNENKTFTPTTLPVGKKAVGGRWVYAIKSGVDGNDQYKARFVAKGYSQKMGVDYGETFSPTADLTSVRIVLQKAVQENLLVHQMDVKTAFLHAPIDYEIYINPPEGYAEKEGVVYKLEKSLYGLKQSGRNWNRVLHDCLTENGFTQNQADHCVYSQESQEGKVIIIVWVDDLIIAASDERKLKKVKGMLAEQFKMKDLGQLKHFLGIDFDFSDDCIKMSQEKYTNKILQRFNMSECRVRDTPCEQKLEYSNDAVKMTDIRMYREAVGSLIYLTTCTRPDLSFVVSRLSQYLAEPTEEQWVTVKHVLRYLKGTANKGLTFRRSTENLGIKAYSDADWAADASDRRSTTGYCVSLSENSALVSWKTKKQPTVALSTCEAEYMALASTVQECLYLEHLLGEMDGYNYTQTVIHEDNQGTIALARNPVNRKRCKHIDIKYHFIRSTVNEGKVNLMYCSTDEMVADVMTKPVSKFKLGKFAGPLFGD